MKKISLVVMAALVLLLTGCSSMDIFVWSSPNRNEETQTNEAQTSQLQTDESKPEESVTSAPETEGPAAEPETDSPVIPQPQQEFTGLKLEISEGALYIRSGDTFSLTDHKGNALKYEISGNVLYFTKDQVEDAVLVLPERQYESLNLIVKNGHVFLECALTVDHLNMDVNKGEVVLNEICVLSDTTAVITDASASLHGDPGKTVTGTCKQGHLNFAVPFQESDCNYNINVYGGDIRIGARNYHGLSYSETINNNGERRMDLTCTHGDLSVEFVR